MQEYNDLVELARVCLPQSRELGLMIPPAGEM
jgi:hypothetical protein